MRSRTAFKLNPVLIWPPGRFRQAAHTWLHALTVLAHSKWRQRCCGHTWLPSIWLFILLHVLLSTVYAVDKKENNKYNFFRIVVVYNLKSDAAVCMIHGLKKKSARVVTCSWDVLWAKLHVASTGLNGETMRCPLHAAWNKTWYGMF